MKFRILVSAFCASVSLLGGVCSTEAWADQHLPTVKVLKADFISPSLALEIYDSAPTPCPIQSCYRITEGAPEIKDLARALGANRLSDTEYSDIVHEYVRANIKLTPIFGLQKGAVGTLLDGSGTAFDQVQLMVELLREDDTLASSVSFEYGTIKLSQKDAANWLGAVYFSNGTSDFSSNALATLIGNGGIPASFSGSDVTLAHIWVKAAGKTYDPALKKHKYLPGIDLGSAMQFSGANLYTAAKGTGDDGTLYGASKMVLGDASDKLAEYSWNLIDLLRTPDHAQKSTAEVIGTKEILPVEDIDGTPIAGFGSVTYSQDVAVGKSWNGDIPDAFRTMLGVQVGGINKKFFVDELYGANLGLMFELGSLHNTDGKVHLLVDYNPVENKVVPAGTNKDALYNVIFTVDHPYAANDGMYMDETTILAARQNKYIGIAYGFGNISSNRLNRSHDRQLGDAELFYQRIFSKHDGLGVSWLAQASALAGFYDNIGELTHQHHHSVGVVAVSGAGTVAALDPDTDMSVVSSFSITSDKNDAAIEEAGKYTLVSGINALEAAVFGEHVSVSAHAQISMVETHSTFVEVDATNWATVKSGLFSDSFGANAASICDDTETIDKFVAAGYSVVLPTRRMTAPNLQDDEFYICDGGEYSHYPLGYFVRNAAANEIAHMVGRSKGGAANVPSIDDQQYIPQSVEVDTQKYQTLDSFEKKIDSATGILSITQTDIQAGSGDFPNALPFSPEYRSSGLPKRTVQNQVFINSPKLTHNYEIGLANGWDVFKSFGATSPVDAVPAIVSAYTSLHLLKSEGTDSLPLLAQQRVQSWWLDELRYNTLTFTEGSNSQSFTRLPLAATENADERAYNYSSRARKTRVEYRADGGITIRKSGAGAYEFPAVHTFDRSERKHAPVSKVTYPTGMEVSFAYTAPYLNYNNTSNVILDSYLLSSVSNSLGHTLSFEYEVVESDIEPNRICCFKAGDIAEVRVSNSTGATMRYRMIVDSIRSGNFINLDWRLKEKLYPEGEKLTYSANEGYLTAVQADSDTLAEFEYDGFGRISRVKDVRGNGTEYYVAGRRTETINAEGEPTVSYYGVQGETKSVDPAGRIRRKSYDRLGRLVALVQPGDLKYLFEYDDRGNLVANNSVPKPGSSLAVMLASVEFPETCDNFITCNKPISITDALGYRTNYEYDNATGLAKRVLGPCLNGSGTCAETDRPITSYDYLSYGRLDTVTNQEDIVTKYEYYPVNAASSVAHTNGELKNVINDFGGIAATTSYIYDPMGNVHQVNGPLSAKDGLDDITTTLYDAMRRPVYNAQGILDTQGLSTDNFIQRVKSANLEGYGATVYDSLGRVVEERRSDEITGYPLQATQNVYQKNGQFCAGNGAPCKVINPEGHATETTYDALNRVDTVTDAENRITKTVYDELGRVKSLFQGWGTEDQILYQHYEYTVSGQVASVMDANCNVTTYAYDGFDRLSAVYYPPRNVIVDIDFKGVAASQACIVDPDDTQSQQQAAWDLQNRPPAFPIDGNHTYGSSTNHGGRQEFYYDANGNVIAQRTRKNSWIIHDYDPLNRLKTKRVYQGGSWNNASYSYEAGTLENTVNYDYYLDGRDKVITQAGGTVSGVEIPDVVLTYGYDTAGRHTSETTQIGTEDARTVSWVLDKAGNRTRLNRPNGALWNSYHYDGFGRLEQVRLQDNEDGQIEFTYDGFSRRKDQLIDTATNGSISTGFKYHRDSVLKSIKHDFASGDHAAGSGTSNLDVSYVFAYSRANQISDRTITNSVFAPTVSSSQYHAYTVNGLNQYESVDELTGASGEVQTSTSLDYDMAGSLTEDGVWTYHYDGENRLVKAVNTGNQNTIKYQYGPKGRRLASISSVGGRTEFAYEGDEPIADYEVGETTSNLLRAYVNGAAVDERLMYQDYSNGETKTYYYHRDHQGSVIGLSEDGLVNSVYTYDPYGNMPAEISGGQPFRYTGRRWDEETGLYYYRARYYSAKLGRFLQTDPIGYEDNMNLYGYTQNDAVNNTDPSGEDTVYCVTQEVGNETILTCSVVKDTLPHNTLVHTHRNAVFLRMGPEMRQIIDGPITKDVITTMVSRNVSLLTGRPVIRAAVTTDEEAREVARKEGNELVKKFKRSEGVGTGARSGQHGTPHKRAGAELQRMAKKESNPLLQKAYRNEAKRLIEKGKSINHR